MPDWNDAPIDVELPAQIVEPVPAFAAGGVFTTTTTDDEFEHPVALIVSTSVYVVVVVGETLGFDIVEVKPAGLEDHEYDLPAVGADPIVADAPKHTCVLFPAKVEGRGLTVMTTCEFAVHPVAVIVSTTVYVVVTVGDTAG